MGSIGAERTADSLVGCSVAGYRLERVIGVGGTSVVYAASRTIAGSSHMFAMKLIDIGDREEEIELFNRECQALSRGMHPNIARLIEFGAAPGGGYYIVLDYVEGLPIDAYCHLNNLGLSERVRLFLGLLAAVDHVHRRGIIHGDINCSHVLVDGAGIPKLLDFGVSRHHCANAPCHEGGQTWLTAGYAAPERFAGVLDHRCDVYSLGIVFQSMLRRDENSVCSPGHHAHTLGSVAAHALTRFARRATIPRDLLCILHTATSRSAEKRYSTVQALTDDLTSFLDRRPVRARGTGALYTVTCLFRRRRVELLATVALIGGLVTFGNTAVRRIDAERRVNGILSAISTDLDSSATTPEREARLKQLDDVLASVDPGLLTRDAADRVVEILLLAGDTAGNATTHNLGNTARARHLYERALDIVDARHKEHPSSALTIVKGAIERRMGDLAAVEVHYSSALAHYGTAERLLQSGAGLEHAERALLELVRVYQQMGFIAEATADKHLARARYTQALRCGIQLRHSSRIAGQTAVANSQEHIASAADAIGDHQAAEQHAALAVSTFRELHAAHPFEQTRAYDLAMVLLVQADIEAKENLAQAAGPLRESIQILNTLSMSDPENVEYMRALSQALLSQANHEISQKHTAAARAATRTALKVQGTLARRPQPVTYDIELFGWIALSTPYRDLVPSDIHSLLTEHMKMVRTTSPILLDLIARSYTSRGEYTKAIEMEELAIEGLPSGSDKTEYTTFLDRIKRKTSRRRQAG